MRRLTGGKREKIIIALMLLLNLAMRLPATPRPVYTDSYATLWHASEILAGQRVVDEEGRPWQPSLNLAGIKRILSGDAESVPALKNYYPLHEPVTYPLSLSVIEQVAGIGLEKTAFLHSITLAVLGLLGAYVMARRYSGNRLFAYAAAFSYSTAPVFVSITSFTAISRSLVAGAAPVILWLILAHNKTRKTGYLAAGFFLTAALLTAHRISLILLAFYAAYALTKVLAPLAGKTKPKRKMMSALPYAYIIALLLLVLLPFSSDKGLFKQAKWDYTKGFFASGITDKIILVNAAADYSSSLGVLSFFAIAGIPLLSAEIKKKPFNQLFLALLLLFLAPLLVFGEYFTLLILPAYCLLTASGLTRALDYSTKIRLLNDGKYILPSFIALLVIASSSFTLYMVDHWLEVESARQLTRPHWADERTAHAMTHFKDFNGRILTPPFSELIAEAGYFIGEGGRLIFSWFDYGAVRSPSADGIDYVLEADEFSGKFFGPFGLPVESPLLKSCRSMCDRVYDNGLVTLWKNTGFF